jgi:hypothetical protein
MIGKNINHKQASMVGESISQTDHTSNPYFRLISGKIMIELVLNRFLFLGKNKACFIRRISVTSNAIKTIDNEANEVYHLIIYFFCVGVMYSGEYDACDVTLSVYPHWTILKNMPGHGGNRTYDLWNTSPPWPGIFFKLARCGYTLRVTSQASLSIVLIAFDATKVFLV